MSLGTGEDEVGIGAALHIRAKSCLHGIIAITGNLLELVDGYDARFVRLVQVCKYLIKRNCRIVDGSQAHAPGGYAVHIKRNLRAQRRHDLDKLLPCSFSFRPKFIHHRLSQHIHKVTQILGSIDIYHKTVVGTTDFLIIEDMPDKIRFTQATRRNESNIVLIEQEFTE